MTVSPEVLEKPTERQRGLGRVYIPNPGSLNYQLREALPRTVLAPSNWKSKRWRMGRGHAFQSQGYTSHCVRYGCTHVLMLEAIVRGNAFDLTKGLYQWAQRNDPWPGEEPSYYGTSVDSGLQYLLHQAKVISEYRWARSMDDVLARLSAKASDGGGPLIVGTDWWSGMDNNDGSGIWTPTGNYRGGHCYVFRGHISPTAKREGVILTGNSHSGNFEGRLSYDAAEYLLFGANGEAAAITEIPRAI